MSNLDKSRLKFVIIYVKCFRHYRTRKMVYPKPPHKFIRLKIRADKWKAYQDRKQGHHNGDNHSNP